MGYEVWGLYDVARLAYLSNTDPPPLPRTSITRAFVVPVATSALALAID